MKSNNIILLGILILFLTGFLEHYFDLIVDGLILYAGFINLAVMGIYSQIKENGFK